MSKPTTIPYANATSGTAAREEITRTLRRFGCESVGFMDDFAEKSVLRVFTHSRPAGATARLGEGLARISHVAGAHRGL
jgi:hypothetical protein